MAHKHNRKGILQECTTKFGSQVSTERKLNKTKLESLNHSKIWNQASNILWGYDQKVRMLILIHVAQVHSIYLKDSKWEKKGTSNSYMNENGSSTRDQLFSSPYETIIEVSFLYILSLATWWPQTQAKSSSFKVKINKKTKVTKHASKGSTFNYEEIKWIDLSLCE